MALDTTVSVALIAGLAGVAGALATGVVTSMTTTRQDQRLEARETVRWRRELAEKDRERIFQLFEQIAALQLELFVGTSELLRSQAPQTVEDQAAVWTATNELAHLCMRATILGANDIGSDATTGLVDDVRRDRREGPVDSDRRRQFEESFNAEAARMRLSMQKNLIRLRTEQ